MKIVDEVKNLQDLMETIEEIITFSKPKYHVFVETDLNKFGNLINEGIIEETKSWCEDNCWGKWDGNGLIFMFELETDAAAFKLRWI
ncbi:hypothetical protein LCGC14_1051170 [marine sediment metagenome]|uniref:Uncharacterized protein n=1 Tax=marine sediment metagenome TaxID=412755 RepID=A0A0F9Q6Y9_9ZZZZ